MAHLSKRQKKFFERYTRIAAAVIAAEEKEFSSVPYNIILFPNISSNQNPPPLAESSKLNLFLLLSDELLLEIFLRLPHGRSVIQCTAVCKRWYSLITDSLYHNNKRQRFICRFVQYHHRKRQQSSLEDSSSCYPVPVPAYACEILFRWNYNQQSDAGTSICNLNFLPLWPDVEIMASVNDLLLVMTRSRRRHFYVCNQHTRQWLSLPEVPYHYCGYGFSRERGSEGYALVCEPYKEFNESFPRHYRYRVVLLTGCQFAHTIYFFNARIFCSETGIWTSSAFSVQHRLNPQQSGLPTPRIFLDVVITSNGVLHWLDGVVGFIDGVIAFDPFSLKGRFINLPDQHLFSHIPNRRYKTKVHLGVVNGRLRLSLLLGFELKVWELNDEDDSWLLVHDVALNSAKGLTFLLAFNPNDGDVIFTVRNRDVCKVEIGKGNYEKVGEFSADESVADMEERIAACLRVFTIVYPLWPTPILPLPSIQSQET